MKRAHKQLDVAAAPQECFDALLDYESMPDWQSSIKLCEVVERDRLGRGALVDWELDARVKTIRYRLSYEYEAPRRVTASLVEGDVKELEGEWSLEEAAGGTAVTFAVALDPGMWVPGPVRKVLEHQVMARAVEDLKRYVES